MAKSTTPAVSADASYNEAVIEMMNRLRSPQAAGGLTLLQRVENFAIDRVADSGEFVSRLGAATVAGFEGAKDSYQLERERQLKRRAERLINASVQLYGKPN